MLASPSRLIRRTLIYLLLLAAISGCVFLPKFSKEKLEPCELFTREMELEMSVLKASDLLDCNGGECLPAMAVLLAVPAGSFIVSGSIVLAGNTIHWLESKGRCEKNHRLRPSSRVG